MRLPGLIKNKIISFKHSKTQQNAAGVFILKIFSTGVAFFVSILIARLAGSDGYGAYAFAISWISILSLFGLLGMNKLIVREYSRYRKEHSYAKSWGLIKFADKACLALAIIISVAVWSFSGWIQMLIVEDDSELLVSALLMALILLPVIVLLRIRQASLEANHQAFIGNLPEMAIAPIVMTCLMIIGWWFYPDKVTAHWAIISKLIGFSLALLVVSNIRYNNITKEMKKLTPEYEVRDWLYSAFPIFLISGLYIINSNTDIIMLGFLAGANSTGIYAVASKIVLLLNFVTLAVNKTLSPYFASYYKGSEIEKLQKLVTRSARITAFVSFCFALLISLFGYWILIIFGSEFIVGQLTLVILCIGKVFNAMMGSVANLLLMSKHERVAAWNILLAVLLNITLNFLLIPAYGIEGAAIASTIALILVNIFQAIAVYNILHINPTAFRYNHT